MAETYLTIAGIIWSFILLEAVRFGVWAGEIVKLDPVVYGRFKDASEVGKRMARSGKHIPSRSQSESSLFRKLFNNVSYVREARPSDFEDEPVEVLVEMAIMKIHRIIERDQEISVSGYLKMSWLDTRLAWNPAEYGGISWLVISPEKIWIPDVSIINSVDMYSVTRDFRYQSNVDSTGRVIWVPAGKLVARCEFDLTYFPFDAQECCYRVESWSYPFDLLSLIGQSFEASPAHYVPDQQWYMTGTTVHNQIVSYEGGAINFSRIDFTLELHRKPLYFVSFTIMPAFILSMLQVFSHFLPVDDTDNRIGFATTGLISFSVLHVSISEQMPKTSIHLPLVAIYVDVVMILIVSFIIESFFISHVLKKMVFTCPNNMLWTFVVKILGRIVLFPVDKFTMRYNDLKSMLMTKKRPSCYVHLDLPVRKVIGQPSPAANCSQQQVKKLLYVQVSPTGILKPFTIETGDTTRSDSHTNESDHTTVTPTDCQESCSECPKKGHRPSETYANGIIYDSPYSSDETSGYQHKPRKRNVPSPTPSSYSSTPPSSLTSNTSKNNATPPTDSSHDMYLCLKSMQSDLALLRKMTAELSDRQLRRVSLEVWTSLIDVLDRYMFIANFTLAVLTPALFFGIMPSTL